jgi:N-acetylglutamate synthase-like GNAT family acetyltransferase
MNINKYTIGLANREHIRMLPEIERTAATLFPDDVLTPAIRASTVPIAHLESAHAEGRLWTAATKAGIPVGFAIAIPEFNSAFLQEVDVHPAHQQRGLGRRLIQTVISWAQMQKLACVFLTTFEHVPWNAPFYSRLGFRKLEEHELNQQLRERLQAERRQGLNQRVAMQFTFGPEQPNNTMQSACEETRA